MVVITITITIIIIIVVVVVVVVVVEITFAMTKKGRRGAAKIIMMMAMTTFLHECKYIYVCMRSVEKSI